MATKLYVGGISYNTDNDGLTAHFAQAGTVVSAQIITDKETGRSKGFGFVEMASEEDAQNAISNLNDKPLDGRNLKVNEARPMEKRTFSGSGPRTGGFQRSGDFQKRF
ncbi:MAG: RNA-binding protein [Patescibacteria group bacterium]|jgi:RNA recognition motif-containing protein